jgi:hypothetical protein
MVSIVKGLLLFVGDSLLFRLNYSSLKETLKVFKNQVKMEVKRLISEEVEKLNTEMAEKGGNTLIPLMHGFTCNSALLPNL